MVTETSGENGLNTLKNKKEENKMKEDFESNIKSEVNLDTVLTKEIGQFGKFQMRTLVLGIIATIFGSWSTTEYVFTTARINTRCRIPECDGSQPEWSPYWLANAAPSTGPNSFDNCQRFSNTSAYLRVVESETCPSGLFDRNTLQPCEEYVYENTHSVVYDVGLACDEWRRSLIGTIRTFGTLTALPITGYVSDRWGRRVALALNTFNTAWIGLIRYWSNTYLGFMMSEFLESTFGAGALPTFYILLMEIVGPKYRVVAGVTINASFAVGQGVMGLIAWWIPNWRNLTLALYIPQLLTVSYFWLVAESVRWYLSKGRFEESETLLKKMAAYNGKTISEKSLAALRDSVEEEAKKKAINEELSGREPWLIVQVFRHKRVLLRCVVSPVWWITNTFIYYGLSINAVNMSGNIYLNFIAVSLVEIPGYLIALFLMGRLGRKPVLIGAFWMCAACQFAYIFMPQDMYALSLTVYLIAKCCSASVMTSVYIYTNELYPTRYRNSLFAFSSMIGRIGSMTAPLTPAMGAQWFEELPFVLFGGMALLSGGLIFLTPETLGSEFPDTMEQANNMGTKHNKTKE